MCYNNQYIYRYKYSILLYHKINFMSSALFSFLGGKTMNLPEIFNSLSKLQESNSISEIYKLNDDLKTHNLALSAKDAKDIIKTRNNVLKAQGRIELNLDVMKSIIKELGKSSYVNQDNLVETISDMYEVFHYVKNSTSDFLCDEEILKTIMFFYNTVYGGSVELIKGKGIEKIIDNFRNNKDIDDIKEEEDN